MHGYSLACSLVTGVVTGDDGKITDAVGGVVGDVVVSGPFLRLLGGHVLIGLPAGKPKEQLLLLVLTEAPNWFHSLWQETCRPVLASLQVTL